MGDYGVGNSEEEIREKGGGRCLCNLGCFWEGCEPHSTQTMKNKGREGYKLAFVAAPGVSVHKTPAVARWIIDQCFHCTESRALH